VAAATGGILLSEQQRAQGQRLLPEISAPDASQTNNRQETYAVEPAFSPLKFGDICPTGWVLAQMRRDLQTGLAGHLDELCHEASSDIFVTGRNSPGKPNRGDVANDSWWNGESEGNWRAGHMMLACLTQDPTAMSKAGAYVKHILASQEPDGYIGIFSPELRYQGHGEFWTQACLFRGMLAYAEATGNEEVYKAVKRSVDRSIEGYAGKSFSFGQHDALYCDILERFHAKTGDKKYLDFGLRIYRERDNLLEFIGSHWWELPFSVVTQKGTAPRRWNPCACLSGSGLRPETQST
jgi:hypothetical protein